jgi:ribosomal protein S18 acetylase RimI-like enzyme
LEVAVDRNIPTYYPGDVIMLRIRFQHQADLVDVWANFVRQEAVTSLRQFHFKAALRDRKELRLLDRAGPQLTSEAVLKALVSKGDPLPGVYELSELHGLPFGEDREASGILDFEVPMDVRLRGYGERLLRAAEEEARMQGCRGVCLSTFSFQARPFYERFGYEVFGELADYPAGHAYYFLKKTLEDPATNTEPG